MTSENQKAPIWFWALALIIVIFNLMLLMSYFQELTLPRPPILVKAVGAIGVFGGIIASLLLILRRKLAQPFFILSWIALLVAVGYNYFMYMENPNVVAHFIATSPVTIGLLAIWFTKFSIGKHWLK